MANKTIVWILVLFSIILTSCSAIQKRISISSAQGVSSSQGSTLQGYLTDIVISKNQYNVGEPIIVTGNFHVQSDGNYYIEFGLDESSYKSLTILESSQSACDNSKHYAGVWANNARVNDVVPFKLTITDYGKTGKYNIVGGVYSRCNVGADVASINPFPVIVSSQAPVTSGSSGSVGNTQPQPQLPVNSCTPSGYFTELWVRQEGQSDLTDNAVPRVIGKFKSTASCTVTYYVESGMLQSSYSPLSVAPSIAGFSADRATKACDQNYHFSGIKLTINPNEEIGFKLFPENYGNDGRYMLQGGVYYNNGLFCGNADIASFAAQQITFAGFAQSSIDSSWVRVI